MFTSAVSVGVSAAGVTPAPMFMTPTDMPTNTPAPPTCGGKYPEKVRSEKQDEVHFQGIDSVLALNINRSLINDMVERYCAIRNFVRAADYTMINALHTCFLHLRLRVTVCFHYFSFVISIEFRALSPNGVIFLAANNDTSQFVSLELVDGNLVYQFNTGSGLIRMRTTGTYSVGGIWYKVELLLVPVHMGKKLSRLARKHFDSTNNFVLFLRDGFPAKQESIE